MRPNCLASGSRELSKDPDARKKRKNIMPELPEVETIRKQISKQIENKKIAEIEVRYVKIIKAPLKKFKGAVLGARIKNVRRRGKLIIIDLSSGFSLLIHLKMTGQLIFAGVVPPRNLRRYDPRHIRAEFLFAGGDRLIFNDIRKFGYINSMRTKDLPEYLDKKYGPEPLDKNFTLAKFKTILAKKPRQKKIKQFLMDQKNIAGIGNIYADEILFRAGVRPDKKTATLAYDEIKKIFQSIKKILNDAIKYRGSSISNYVDSQGRAGKYHLRLKAYGRAGQPCPKCKTPITKIILSGRGTHFCPNCQK